MKKSTADALICLGVYAVLGVFLAQYSAIPASAQGYPLFMLVATAIVNTILFISSICKLRKEETVDASQREKFMATVKMVAVYCVLIGVYVLLIEKISYIASTVLFMAGSMLFLRVKSKPMLVLLPVLMTLGVYFIFTRLLAVSLPIGTWFYIAL